MITGCALISNIFLLKFNSLRDLQTHECVSNRRWKCLSTMITRELVLNFANSLAKPPAKRVV